MDLPEPKATNNPQAKLEHRWTIISVVNTVILVYSALHKLIIPLVRNLNPHQHTNIDWFWIFFLVFGILIIERNRHWLLSTAFFGLGYTGFKLSSLIYTLVSNNQPFHWMYLSIFLTDSLAFIFLSFCIKEWFSTYQNTRGFKKLAWFFFIFLGVLTSILFSMRTIKAADHFPVNKTTKASTNHIVLNPEDMSQIQTIKQLVISRQGFESNIFKGTELVITNRSGSFINLNIHGLPNYMSINDWHFLKNIPLFNDQSFTMKEKDTRRYDIIKVYSDSNPDIGMAIILRPSLHLANSLTIDGRQ
ncbi:MAG: hypothetical protein KDD48_05750 [Bdellovibrionales bacterium]|nr:hypothetical protein [Bdellovibrionales bacterium]